MSDFDRIRSMGSSDYQERRRKVDWVVKMATILSLVSWLNAIAVWFVLDFASPERETFFSSLARSNRTIFGSQETVIRTEWDGPLVLIAFIMLIVSLAVCVAAFFFNKARMRRKTDKYRKSIIIIGAATIVAIVVFLFTFGLPFIG